MLLAFLNVLSYGDNAFVLWLCDIFVFNAPGSLDCVPLVDTLSPRTKKVLSHSQ